MRTDERVTPLELFFDLVFVLALTQCTALMADDPSGRGWLEASWCSECCGGRGSATPGSPVWSTPRRARSGS
ncbi:MAG: low temperature requirement protein A [Thermoleophilaceae bacterium]|nr:low temperature requirement protein A [Thermoleophilaceae bacterium]